MNDERRKNLDKLMEITKAPLIDKLEKALKENTTLKEVNDELLEALKACLLKLEQNNLEHCNAGFLADEAIRKSEEQT